MKKGISKFVTVWLIVGLVMVYFQIVIGGITRLTGSGLSITKWEVVTGILPPLSEKSWITEFDKYKKTPQYKKINKGMELGSIFRSNTFKFIYFWEYLHRLWARSMGFVFLFPFMFFYFKKWIPRSLIRRLGLVILLAVLAATFGWIMVASGLVNRPWVNAYKLSLHLCIGISVFAALWWAFISYIHPRSGSGRVSSSKKYLRPLLFLLIVQIFLGGVMSGTKAALFINTWPDLNGEMIPSDLLNLDNWTANNFNNYESTGFVVSLIQLLHRSVAYIIAAYSIVIMLRQQYYMMDSTRARSYIYFVALLVLQVVVGILTLIKSIGIIPVYWGVLHQGVAVLVLAAFLYHYYFSTRVLAKSVY